MLCWVYMYNIARRCVRQSRLGHVCDTLNLCVRSDIFQTKQSIRNALVLEKVRLTSFKFVPNPEYFSPSRGYLAEPQLSVAAGAHRILPSENSGAIARKRQEYDLDYTLRMSTPLQSFHCPCRQCWFVWRGFGAVPRQWQSLCFDRSAKTVFLSN